MSVVSGDPRLLSGRYLEHQRAKMRLTTSPDRAYQCAAEPLSSAFADHVRAHFIGIENAGDPLRAMCVSEYDITWNAQTVEVFDKLEARGITDLSDFFRTGGIYQTPYPNKKLLKQLAFSKYLEGDALDLFRSPEWEDWGKPLMLQLIDCFHKRSLENNERLKVDASSLTIGKPGNTGTGYMHPYSTREDMQKRYAEAAPSVEQCVESWYQDLKAAISVYPEQFSEIRTSAPFKGVKGARSAADVLSTSGVNYSHMVVGSATRDVSNEPSSPLHNKSLNDAAFQELIWN